MMEFRLFQPGIHVAEGILVGHQIDEPLPAIGVQFLDVFGGQAVKIRRFFGISGVLEAVPLHVQLKFVVFQHRQKIDHALDGFHLGHPAPADIQHVSPAGQGGLIPDLRIGQLSPGIADHLQQGGNRPEQALVRGCGNGNAFFAHAEKVFFFFQHRRGNHADPRRAFLYQLEKTH